MKSFHGDTKLKADLVEEMKTRMDKANRAQRIVCDFLEKHGFTLAEVRSPSANGVDIVAIKNRRHFSIEVKNVIRTCRSWRVNKPNLKSDMIAVVFPNNVIHFECISDWLKLCDKNNARRITRLVDFHLTVSQ